MSNTTTQNAAGKAPEKSGPKKKQWSEVSTDRELVSWDQREEAGIKDPITGWLVDEIRLKEETEDMPAFDVLVIRLTEEMVNVRDGQKYPVPVGTDVCIPKSARLASLADIAKHPTEVREVRISPKDKIKIGGGKMMRKFGVQLSDQVGRRVDLAPLTLNKYAGSQAPALAAPSPGTNFP